MSCRLLSTSLPAPHTDEARATLAAGGCPLALAQRCEQGYRASSKQPGFDGPLIVELSMLRLLVSIYQVRRRHPHSCMATCLTLPAVIPPRLLPPLLPCSQELGDSYAQLFHDLRLADLQQAKQVPGAEVQAHLPFLTLLCFTLYLP